MNARAPQPANLVGTINPDQYNVLASTNPAELTPEAQEIVRGLGSTMLENDYALVVDTDQAGQSFPKAYVTLKEGDQGTVISSRNYDALGLPPLADAQAAIAAQHTRKLADHVAGKAPYFGPKPGMAAGARSEEAAIDARLRERHPQPPLTATDIARIGVQRGKPMSQADIDGINAARARGLHLS